MTDLERKNFLHFLATRPPGKRQVKPNFEYLNALAGGEDESDEEFHGPEGSVGSDEEDNSDSDESGSDEEEDDESGQPSTSGKEEEDVVIIPPDEEADFKAGILKPGSSIQAAQLLCSICLNLRESMKNDPVIQCDKCGVAVHEICYMVEDFNEVESQDSSAATEPWFCEPCLFGLAEPPFCELCPNRYGAFKRADVGGQWVHLACALYTPGITFGDVDRYSAISWQEIDHRNFGRKACVACTNRLEARTGITTQCEAAMCKNYYHITCAQKLGLLINAENNEQNYHDLPPLYLLCKKHSNSDYTRTKREAYARLVQQEENRFVTMKRHLLDGRELRKKERQKENYIKRMQSFEGSTIIWPDHDEKEKRGRLIQTSARFLESFAEKAELAGVEKNDFEKAFAWIPTEQLPIMPPAFTDEFFRFYNHRETNVIPEEETRLSDAKKKRDVVLKEQRQLEQAIKESNEKSPGKRQHADVNKVRLSKFYNVLINLGVKKVKKPKTPSPIRSPQPSTSTSYTATKVLQKPSFVPKTKPNILRRVPPSKIGNMNVKITEAPLLDTSFSPKSIPKLDLNGPSLGQTAQLNGVYSPLLENSKEPLKTKNRPKIYESLGKPPSGNKNSSKTHRGSKLISSSDSAMKPPVLDHYPRTSTSSRAESRMSRNDSVADKVVAEEIINECFKCKKNTDQHLLIYCNTCKHHCHLGCLDPPLKKMPKLDKNAMWECADCAFPSEDEAEIEEVVKEDPDSTIASRRPKRDRSNALLEKRKLEEAETNRAFRSVMSQNRHKRPRISSTLNSSTLSKTSSAIHSPTPKKSRVEMEKSENTVEDLNSSQHSQEL